MKTRFAMASICEAPMPTYEQGGSARVIHMARTHPVVAAPQLVHFGLLASANNRLPGRRGCEFFFSKNITNVRFELGLKLCTPVFNDVLRIDYLGYPGIARGHSASLSHLGSLQTTSISCRTHCLKITPWCCFRDGTSHDPALSHVYYYGLLRSVHLTWACVS